MMREKYVLQVREIFPALIPWEIKIHLCFTTKCVCVHIHISPGFVSNLSFLKSIKTVLKPIKQYDKQIYQIIIIPIQYNIFLLTKVSLHRKPDSS